MPRFVENKRIWAVSASCAFLVWSLLAAINAAPVAAAGAAATSQLSGSNSYYFSIVDPARHLLFAADGANNRVLVFQLDGSNMASSQTPIHVLGQADFSGTSSGVSSTQMWLPEGLAFEASTQRLFVADTANSRVLVFNTGTISDGMAASFVLGQSDFTTGSSHLTQSGLGGQAGQVALDDVHHRLYVADFDSNRVTAFGTSGLATGEPALYVLGQTSFTTNGPGLTSSTLNGPNGVTYDAVHDFVAVADYNNDRVLIFSSATTNGLAASHVVGQTNFMTQGTAGVTASTLHSPAAVAVDSSGARLFVSDYENSRVLAYSTSSISDGMAAVDVYGQYDMGSSGSGTANNRLDHQVGVDYLASTNTLVIADYFNHRLLFFGTGQASSTATASVVIDPAFTFAVSNRSTACNGEANFVSSAGTASSIALGHVGAGAVVSGGQTLSVASNAGAGFAIYVRSGSASGNLASPGHAWSDALGTYASPAILGAGERFGYTYQTFVTAPSVVNPASGQFVRLTNAADNQISGSTTSSSGSACIAFSAQTSAATPAATYLGVVIYTAVPTF